MRGRWAALISRLAAKISPHTGDAGTSDLTGPVSVCKCLNKARTAFSDIGNSVRNRQKNRQA